jgi:hypothetical protein
MLFSLLFAIFMFVSHVFGTVFESRLLSKGSIPKINHHYKNTNNNTKNVMNNSTLSACNFATYSQCSSSWGGQELGTCSSQDICSAGCAMTSVAMMLQYYGIIKNPSQLNSWLKSNGGYANGCNIVWASVDKLKGQMFTITIYITIISRN